MSSYKQLEKMRLEILGDVADKSKDKVFETKLDDAEIVALNALYPYNDEIQRLPQSKRLENWQVRDKAERDKIILDIVEKEKWIMNNIYY